MTGLEAIGGVRAPDLGAVAQDRQVSGMGGAQTATSLDFGRLVSSGISRVEDKVVEANDLVSRFTLDDSIPVHQVTMALEEARLAVELAVQVRSRLVEGYREVMNMQL